MLGHFVSLQKYVVEELHITKIIFVSFLFMDDVIEVSTNIQVGHIQLCIHVFILFLCYT
jgi:hypothetical protein